MPNEITAAMSDTGLNDERVRVALKEIRAARQAARLDRQRLQRALFERRREDEQLAAAESALSALLGETDQQLNLATPEHRYRLVSQARKAQKRSAWTSLLAGPIDVVPSRTQLIGSYGDAMSANVEVPQAEATPDADEVELPVPVASRKPTAVAGVLEILSESETPMAVNEIVKEFERRGWLRAGAKRPAAAIYEAARRLALPAGRIERVDTGVYRYREGVVVNGRASTPGETEGGGEQA